MFNTVNEPSVATLPVGHRKKIKKFRKVGKSTHSHNKYNNINTHSSDGLLII